MPKATSQLLFEFSDSLQICFTVVGLLLTYLNTPILKAWASASRAQRPLTTGIVRRHFPSLRAPRDATMVGAIETALASSTYVPFTWRLLTFTAWNWKCHVIIGIKTDLTEFVVPMHSGLCEQNVESPGLTFEIGFDYNFIGHLTPGSNRLCKATVRRERYLIFRILWSYISCVTVISQWAHDFGCIQVWEYSYHTTVKATCNITMQISKLICSISTLA